MVHSLRVCNALALYSLSPQHSYWVVQNCLKLQFYGVWHPLKTLGAPALRCTYPHACIHIVFFTLFGTQHSGLLSPDITSFGFCNNILSRFSLWRSSKEKPCSFLKCIHSGFSFLGTLPILLWVISSIPLASTSFSCAANSQLHVHEFLGLKLSI